MPQQVWLVYTGRYYKLRLSLHKSFQMELKHSYKLIHTCKNIIKHRNGQSAKGNLDKGGHQKPLNQFQTWAGAGQVWAASQVHLHGPCSTSNQQSRLVMTGCCCQRAVHTHRSTNSYNSEEHLHAHSQTYNRHLSFSTFLTILPLCASPSSTTQDIFTPRLGSFTYYLTGQHISNKTQTAAVQFYKQLPTCLQSCRPSAIGVRS